MHVDSSKGKACIFFLIILSTQHTIYPTCQLNTPNIKINHSTLRHFLQLTIFHRPLEHKKSESQNCRCNISDPRKSLVFYTFSVLYFSTRDINTTHSTWLDCSRLMSDFRGCSREFIKACFCIKTHRFLPLYVLGNRSKAMLLPIICKRTDLPTASRLRSEGTSLKSHRLNSIAAGSDTCLFRVQTPVQ